MLVEAVGRELFSQAENPGCGLCLASLDSPSRQIFGCSLFSSSFTMHRYGLRTATAYTLLGQAVAQLATRTVGGEFHHTQPAPADLELRRRQLDSDITSGTISITVAPDETCGFDQFGDTDSAWICKSSRHCSWESGRLNLVFCGLQNLITTCQDSTFAIDTDLCDNACQSNTLIGAW